MAEQPNITRRSIFKGLPLAAIAASLPRLAQDPEADCPVLPGNPPLFDTERALAAMQRLRDKANVLNIGDVVNLSLKDAEYPDAPCAGVHEIAEIDDTFVKVRGNDHWVPIERVNGRFENTQNEI